MGVACMHGFAFGFGFGFCFTSVQMGCTFGRKGFGFGGWQVWVEFFIDVFSNGGKSHFILFLCLASFYHFFSFYCWLALAKKIVWTYFFCLFALVGQKENLLSLLVLLFLFPEEWFAKEVGIWGFLLIFGPFSVAIYMCGFFLKPTSFFPLIYPLSKLRISLFLPFFLSILGCRCATFGLSCAVSAAGLY